MTSLLNFTPKFSPVKKEQLKFEEWAMRFDSLFEYLKVVCTTNLLVLGSRISEKWVHFKQYLKAANPVKGATFKNNAGIINAAKDAHKNSASFAEIKITLRGNIYKLRVKTPLLFSCYFKLQIDCIARYHTF